MQLLPTTNWNLTINTLCPSWSHPIPSRDHRKPPELFWHTEEQKFLQRNKFVNMSHSQGTHSCCCGGWLSVDQSHFTAAEERTINLQWQARWNFKSQFIFGDFNWISAEPQQGRILFRTVSHQREKEREKVYLEEGFSSQNDFKTSSLRWK